MAAAPEAARSCSSITPDLKEIVTPQVAAFNKQNPDGDVDDPGHARRHGPYFDQLRTQFQGGGTDIDVITGDIIWPPQFAANGWIADLSDRFTEAERSRFIPGVIAGNTYEGNPYGVPCFTDAGLLSIAPICSSKPVSARPRAPGMSSRRWRQRSSRIWGPRTASCSPAPTTKAGRFWA